MSASKVAARIVAEYEACPDLSGNAGRRAWQASEDARELAVDVRDLDPRQIWGRLSLVMAQEPERFLALVVELAARIDIDAPSGSGAAWARSIGGTAALHPDHGVRKPMVTPNTPDHERDAEIERLTAAGLSAHEIAVRLGVHCRTVERRRQMLRAKEIAA